MRVDLFDFDLPQDRIALRPCEPREAARLLMVEPGAEPRDGFIGDLPACLRPGDALVVNDTRVIPARLEGTRRRGDITARIEAMLHKREDAACWHAFVRPAKKLKSGEHILFKGARASLDAEVLRKGEDGKVLLRFALAGAALDAALFDVGHMPLPPYIASHRAVDAQDDADYQTIFGEKSGAVAAPTASLHFTPGLLDAIAARGVSLHRLTLHVGAGTFLPVKAEDTDAHKMHAEWAAIDARTADALNRARAAGGRVVAVGTTSLRTLETAALPSGEIEPFCGDTSIFITPGYRFRAVDLLLTNFHLPRSTLFMLVAAFSGLSTIQAAYRHAIDAGYRFYSYGDACLLRRQT